MILSSFQQKRVVLAKEEAIDNKRDNCRNKQREIDPVRAKIPCDVDKNEKNNTRQKRFNDIADCLPGHLIAGLLSKNNEKAEEIKKRGNRCGQ